ncbi:NAD(P)-binding domain-containing protein, partial [Salmonella enterica subsp. enterica serovar Cerro]|nr:NAD(P)-binding domain-containing protein [Salmonella enterica subsp. enterica serovar Cerro]
LSAEGFNFIGTGVSGGEEGALKGPSIMPGGQKDAYELVAPILMSEIHSAFGFLENISLWDVTSTVQGVESLEPITLGAVLIAILV